MNDNDRRLYVGNIPIDNPPSEQVLADFFNDAMIQRGLSPANAQTQPVVSVWKRYSCVLLFLFDGITIVFFCCYLVLVGSLLFALGSIPPVFFFLWSLWCLSSALLKPSLTLMMALLLGAVR